VCAYVRVCMHVRMMYVCAYVCINDAYMYTRVNISKYVCMYVSFVWCSGIVSWAWTCMSCNEHKCTYTSFEQGSAGGS
jgi:hypothetical protein